MTRTVHVHAAVAKQLEAIPPDRRKRILDDVFALEEDFFRGLVKPLKGKAHKGHYHRAFRLRAVPPRQSTVDRYGPTGPVL
jgi:mRNA-degrading endonuclease RelE of RelBE toxin-antitoxin system